MQNEYIILVLRILLKYIPWLGILKNFVPDHIEHAYSKEMSMKSTIISLPVQPFNQNKLQDVVQYLDSVESFVKKIAGRADLVLGTLLLNELNSEEVGQLSLEFPTNQITPF